MKTNRRVTEVETERLLLRNLRYDDAEAMTALLQDREISRWTTNIPWPYTIEHARWFIGSQNEPAQEEISFVWAIVERATGRFMGVIGLHDVSEDWTTAFLGYWMGHDYRGRGYTTEAARGLLQWAFEAGGFDRIDAKYLIGNGASAQVMRNSGMQFQRLLPNEVIVDGEFHDMVLFSIANHDVDRQRSDRGGKDS